MSKKHTQEDMWQRIIDAALDMAVEKSWENVTLHDIAERAGIPFEDLAKEVDEKSRILAMYEVCLNRSVFENLGGGGKQDENPRDRLFDIMMERFELMGDRKAAIKSISMSFYSDPKQAILGAPHLAASMNWMLEVSGIDTFGVRGALKVAGLTAIYMKVLKDWIKDDTEDMSVTMASLDRTLGTVEKFADRIGV